MILSLHTPGIPTPVSAKALAHTIGRVVDLSGYGPQDTGMFPSTALTSRVGVN